MAKKKENKEIEVKSENRHAEFESKFATGSVTRLDFENLVEEFFGDSAKKIYIDSRQVSVEVDGIRIPEEGNLVICR
jgi:hypothetical protein